jgi:uncharacterized protein (TIGR02647 family)
MKFNQTATDELNILIQYDLSNTQQGIKIHHDAEINVIEAAKRLHDKGLIDKPDGGYLTSMGRIACESVHSIHGILLK